MGGHADIAVSQPAAEKAAITFTIVPTSLFSYASVSGNELISHIEYSAVFYQGEIAVDSNAGSSMTDVIVNMDGLVNGVLMMYVDYVTVGGLRFQSRRALRFDGAGNIDLSAEVKGIELTTNLDIEGNQANICTQITVQVIADQYLIESGNGWALLANDGEFLEIQYNNEEVITIDLPTIEETNDPNLGIIYFAALDDVLWVDLPYDFRNSFFGVLMELGNECGPNTNNGGAPLSEVQVDIV